MISDNSSLNNAINPGLEPIEAPDWICMPSNDEYMELDENFHEDGIVITAEPMVNYSDGFRREKVGKAVYESSYSRRRKKHDYRSQFIYHIILKKNPSFPAFGRVEGDARIKPGSPGCAKIKLNEFGAKVLKAIFRYGDATPSVRILQFVIMPDHIHLIFQILKRTNLHLGNHISSLKQFLIGDPKGDTSYIFQKNYTDKPLFKHRSLNGWFQYLKENPHRLAMRQQYPQFFQMIWNMMIGNKQCQGYGNLFLLRNPDKVAVKLSRKFTFEEKTALEEDWLVEAAKGSILVSPFISQAEKGVRLKAEEIGASIILITHEIFPERFKPAKHNFDLCSAGRLLIISMGHPLGTPLSREICNEMNELAALLAAASKVP